MYTKLTLSEVQKIMHHYGNKFGIPCNHVPIELSFRLKTTYGYYRSTSINGNRVPIKFMINHDLLNAKYDIRYVSQILLHEYLHFYCDMKTNTRNGHNPYFKKTCRELGCLLDGTTSSEKETMKKFKELEGGN